MNGVGQKPILYKLIKKDANKNKEKLVKKNIHKKPEPLN